VSGIVYIVFNVPNDGALHRVIEDAEVFTTLADAKASVPEADWRQRGHNWLDFNLDTPRAFITIKEVQE
jgi:hypothetical protein